jgi:hypothetical protein
VTTNGTPSAARPLGAVIARYGLARAGLVAAVTAVLVLVGVPLLIALMVGFVVALPLSLLLLKGPRRDLDAALAVHGRRRRAQKAALRAQLRGEAGSAGKAQPEAHPGADRPGEHHHGGVAEYRDQVPARDAAEHPPDR